MGSEQELASRARPDRINDAFEILRASLAPETLVVFAKSVGRAEERILISDLAQADLSQVDMSTLVLVGASGTRVVTRETGPAFVYTSRKAP